MQPLSCRQQNLGNNLVGHPVLYEVMLQVPYLMAPVWEEHVVDAADGESVGGLPVAKVEGALGVLHLVAERVRLQVLSTEVNLKSFVLLSRTQTGPGRAVKQEQE